MNLDIDLDKLATDSTFDSEINLVLEKIIPFLASSESIMKIANFIFDSKHDDIIKNGYRRLMQLVVSHPNSLSHDFVSLILNNMKKKNNVLACVSVFKWLLHTDYCSADDITKMLSMNWSDPSSSFSGPVLEIGVLGNPKTPKWLKSAFYFRHGWEGITSSYIKSQYERNKSKLDHAFYWY
jgi:hypothetical protein